MNPLRPDERWLRIAVNEARNSLGTKERVGDLLPRMASLAYFRLNRLFSELS